MKISAHFAALITGLSLASASLFATTALAQDNPPMSAPAEGVLRLKSANSFDETVVRLKADVNAKGIRLFDEIDQTALGAGAKLDINRSTLVIFGNPPLGVQFLQANPYAGIDWPVRMLVIEDTDHTVWVAWTDFAAIAQRYHITNRDTQLRMASEVAASIAAAAAKS
jgi:uncharacterized protein (DUF302 family)